MTRRLELGRIFTK